MAVEYQERTIPAAAGSSPTRRCCTGTTTAKAATSQTAKTGRAVDVRDVEAGGRQHHRDEEQQDAGLGQRREPGGDGDAGRFRQRADDERDRDREQDGDPREHAEGEAPAADGGERRPERRTDGHGEREAHPGDGEGATPVLGRQDGRSRGGGGGHRRRSPEPGDQHALVGTRW
jgi:hypothetical protein